MDEILKHDHFLFPPRLPTEIFFIMHQITKLFQPITKGLSAMPQYRYCRVIIVRVISA